MNPIEDRLRDTLNDAATNLPPAPPPEDDPLELETPPVSAPTTTAVAAAAPAAQPVGTDGAVPAVTDFEAFYAATRPAIYRALAVTVRDRDVATEAVDRAYGAVYRRRKRLGARPAEAAVFAAGVAWSARAGSRSGAIRGFRLDRTGDLRDEWVSAAFSDLPLTQRAALTVTHLLGWQGAKAATALDIDPGSVSTRTSEALRTLTERLDERSQEETSHRLNQALQLEAAGHTVPMSRLETARGYAWTRRLTMATGVAAAVLVVGGGAIAGYQALTSTEEVAAAPANLFASTTVPGSSTDPTTSDTTDPAVGAVELVWEQVPLGFQGDVSSLVHTGGSGFLLMGQSWSERGGSQTFALTSSDGYEWVETNGPQLEGEGWINQVVAGDFGMAALGSEFDQFSGTDRPFVFLSTDEGATWTKSVLPVDQEQEIAGISVRFYHSAQSITGTGNTLVVIGDGWADIGDPERVLRDVLPDDVGLNFGWGMNGSQIEVFGPNGEVVYTGDLVELGLDPALAGIINQNSPVVWTSTDRGESWTVERAVASFGQGTWLGRVTAADGRYVALVHQQFGAGLWHSDDLQSWTRIDLDRGAVVNDVVRATDGFVAIGSVSGTAAIWESSDGVAWTRLDSGIEAAFVERISVGPNGMAMLAQGSAPWLEGGPAEVAVDGWLIEIDRSGHYTLTGDDGSVLEFFGEEVTYTGDGGVVFSDPNSGEVIAEVTGRELERAWEDVWNRQPPVEQPEGPDYRLLLSSDGETWSMVDLTGAFGPGFYPNQMAVGPASVVLTGWQESFGDGPQPQATVWVGEPATDDD